MGLNGEMYGLYGTSEGLTFGLTLSQILIFLKNHTKMKILQILFKANYYGLCFKTRIKYSYIYLMVFFQLYNISLFLFSISLIRMQLISSNLYIEKPSSSPRLPISWITTFSLSILSINPE